MCGKGVAARLQQPKQVGFSEFKGSLTQAQAFVGEVLLSPGPIQRLFGPLEFQDAHGECFLQLASGTFPGGERLRQGDFRLGLCGSRLGAVADRERDFDTDSRVGVIPGRIARGLAAQPQVGAFEAFRLHPVATGTGHLNLGRRKPQFRMVLHQLRRAREGFGRDERFGLQSRIALEASFRLAHPVICLLQRILLASSKPGDVILDPFFGTGTTGAVAKYLGRNFIGIERDEDYAQVAMQRIDGIEPLDKKDFTPLPSKRSAPKVPFGTLLELGFLSPGTRLYDKTSRVEARIRADGSLACEALQGSIHKLGAKVMGRTACNGWTFWHYKEGEMLQPIDHLRDKARLELGLASA